MFSVVFSAFGLACISFGFLAWLAYHVNYVWSAVINATFLWFGWIAVLILWGANG